MRSFTRFVDKLPFAGKMSIKPLVFSLYQSTTRFERKKKYRNLSIFLFLFALLHVVQLNMGIQALHFTSPVWAKVVSFLYAAANFAVVVTQFHLLYRVTRFYFKGSYPRGKVSYCEHTGTEMLTMLAVTLIGQIIFLSQYNWYN